jgi:hypothetical protein
MVVLCQKKKKKETREWMRLKLYSMHVDNVLACIEDDSKMYVKHVEREKKNQGSIIIQWNPWDKLRMRQKVLSMVQNFP